MWNVINSILRHCFRRLWLYEVVRENTLIQIFEECGKLYPELSHAGLRQAAHHHVLTLGNHPSQSSQIYEKRLLGIRLPRKLDLRVFKMQHPVLSITTRSIVRKASIAFMSQSVGHIILSVRKGVLTNSKWGQERGEHIFFRGSLYYTHNIYQRM